MYEWMVFLHVASTFAFVLAHGTSVFVSFRLRKERDLERVRMLLDLSGSSLGVMYISLLFLLVTGIAAGFMRNWWGQGWMWASLGLLIVLIIVMFLLASSFYANLRRAAGLPYYGMKESDPPDPVSADELAQMVSSLRPFLITTIGIGGLLIILWLMMFKPF